jgi:hypothetical protein
MTNSELLNEHPPIDKAVMAFLGGILPGLGKMDGTAKPKTPEEAWADADEQARDVMRAGVAAVIRTQLDELRAALEPFAKCAEQLKNRTDFGDKVIVSVGQTVLTLDDFNQARKALGGTNVG